MSWRKNTAQLVYYPTLGYNYLLGRMLRVRNWWDFVDENVLLGARPFRSDAAKLKLLGVSGVVNMCEEYQGPVAEYEALGIEQLWLATTDFHHPSTEQVQRGADFIQEHVERGGKVYVHCKAGRARSATIVLWWLVLYRGMSPAQAQQLMLTKRPHVNAKIELRPVIQELYAKSKLVADV